MRSLIRLSHGALSVLVCLTACQRHEGVTAPLNGPEVLALSLRVTPDSAGLDDLVSVEMLAENPTAWPIQLAPSACMEDLLALSLLDTSGTESPTISGIPCKLRATNQVLPSGGTIAKNLRIGARGLLGTHALGSYRVRLEYRGGSTRILGPSVWLQVR